MALSTDHEEIIKPQPHGVNARGLQRFPPPGLCEPLAQIVDERAHARREMLAVRIDRVQRRGGHRMPRQHAAQLAGEDVVALVERCPTKIAHLALVDRAAIRRHLAAGPARAAAFAAWERLACSTAE